MHRTRGAVRKAYEVAREALEIARRINDPIQVAITHAALGDYLGLLGGADSRAARCLRNRSSCSDLFRMFPICKSQGKPTESLMVARCGCLASRTRRLSRYARLRSSVIAAPIQWRKPSRLSERSPHLVQQFWVGSRKRASAVGGPLGGGNKPNLLCPRQTSLAAGCWPRKGSRRG